MPIKIDSTPQSDDKMDLPFSELTYYANLLKADIFEWRFEMVEPSNEISKYTQDSWMNKKEFEIVVEDKYSNGQRTWLEFSLISKKDKLKIVRKDTFANRIPEFMIEAEKIKETYYQRNKELLKELLVKKISEYWSKLSFTLRPVEIRDITDPFSGYYKSYISSEFLSYVDILPIVANQTKVYHSLVELEKQLLDIKISRISEFYVYMKSEKEAMRALWSDMNTDEDNGMVTYADMLDIYSETEASLEEKLKLIYNYIEDHGGKIQWLKPKYKIDRISWLAFNKKKISEYEDYFDIIEVNDYQKDSISDYLESFSKYDKEFVSSIIDKEEGLEIYWFDLEWFEALSMSFEDCDDETDKSYCDSLKKAKTDLETGKSDVVRVNYSGGGGTYYTMIPNLSVTNDIALQWIADTYSLSEWEKQVLDTLNLYQEITASNYKTF